MISNDVLRKGLAALGEAYGRKTDSATERLWQHALRELSDAQFRYGVDAVIRGPERFFPPPGVVLAAGFDMPRSTAPTPVRYALPEWDGDDQAALLQVIRDNPISAIETGTTAGSMHYIRRIAIEAGLMTDDANPAKSMASRQPGEEG